jgi:hypothetical protein
MGRRSTDWTAHELSEKLRVVIERVDLLASFLAVLAKPVPPAALLQVSTPFPC